MKRQKLAGQARQQVAEPDMGFFLVRRFNFLGSCNGCFNCPVCENLHLSIQYHDKISTISALQSRIKRERRKQLPEGVDFWDFDCRFGHTVEAAKEIHLSEISKFIDQAVEQQVESFYLEILAKQGYRKGKTTKEIGD